MDEQRRGRIQDDLKGFFKGDLYFDESSRSLYSTDASIFQVQPAGVALPRDEEDLQNLIRYAYQEKVPLIPRGGGTGLAGESLGRGLIVDLSKHLRGILEVGEDSVRVQPGVVLDRLQERLRQVGRRFAVQPASGWACTIGGMVATNASGAQGLIHGYMHDHVRELRLLVDNGDAITVGQVRLPLPHSTGSTRLNEILEQLLGLLEQNAPLIRAQQPRTPYNRCGYLLDGILGLASLDLKRLLCGSEGTLGFIAEATLRTIPLASGSSGAVFCFDSLEKALRAGQQVAASRPATCDLLGRRLFSMARTQEDSGLAPLIPAEAEAVLLLEFEADTTTETEARLALCLGELRAANLAPLASFVPQDARQQRELARLRDTVLPSLFAVKGGAQPVSFIEDVAVPVESLPECVFRIQEILKEQETTATFLIHAATGQIHTRPFLDLTNPDHVARLSSLSEQVHSLVLNLGGSISSQHGVGLARSAWVARQYGPLYPVLRQVKAIFDPHNIFNPGKIVEPDTDLGAWPLRRFASSDGARTLHWRDGELRTEANHCNGCGHCRTESPQERMCPVFRAEHGEAAAPRGKANLVRNLLAGANGDSLALGAANDVAERCVHCKMCSLECPARVNVSKLMLEVKAAHVAQQGMERGDWFLSRLQTLLRWGSAVPFLANFVLRSSVLRWVLEKIFGLSSQRHLPKVARRSFWSVARRNGWTVRNPARRPTVVYFPDLYATYIDPDLGEATALVLEHNGFDVFVPPGIGSSGMEALVAGDADAARDMAMGNLRALAELAREGLPIVCSEPSSVVMLRQDYLDLIDDLDSRLVSERATEVMTFLGGLARQGKLQTDFTDQDWNVAHHVPCHVKALNRGIHGPELLQRVPGASIRTLDVSCSGMAGTFGLKARNLATSLAAGRPMLEQLDSGPYESASSECSSCRLQMENVAGKRALHPVQYLALAYGLLPRLADRLKMPVKGKLTL